MPVKTRIPFLITILLILPAVAAALSLPRSNPVPGGVAVVPIDITADKPPEVLYNGRLVMVVWEYDHWVAVVGIPLSVEPGVQALSVRSGNRLVRLCRTRRARADG